MTQPFADALTWMPKSRALGVTLARAYDLARAHGHAEISLEHLLQALIEDPDASALLLGCSVDLLKLNVDVDNILKVRPSTGSDNPQIAPGLTIILEYAAAAARQSKRTDVNGAIVIAAMVGEGKSEAAQLLTANGLKFQDAIAALRRVTQTRSNAPDLTAAAPSPAPAPSAPIADDRSSTSNASPDQPPQSNAAAAPAPEVSSPVVATPVAATSHSRESPSADAPPATAATAREDEDPITAARRRVAALRTTPGPAHLAPPPPPLPGAASASNASADAWAPMPDTGSANGVAAASRPARMPPPVPPLSVRPPSTSGISGGAGRSEARAIGAAKAPWTDTAVAEPQSDVVVPFPTQPAAAARAAAIDVAELGEALPYRMKEGVASTIEVLIPRSAVLATVAALASGGRDTSITRALTVRLKAPDGGLYVDVSAPETQWFDSRGSHRPDDEARWRWIVTPHEAGSRQLHLSVSIRTIAADGTILETALPEHAASVKVVSNFREGMRGLGRGLLAVSAGAMLALLANGGFAKIFGQLLK